MLNPIEKFKVTILHLNTAWNHCFVSASCNVTCKNGGYPAPDSCKCICPRFFKGEMCEQIDTTGLSPDCAGLELTDKTGSLIPPQKNGGYEFGKTCMWIIKVMLLLFPDLLTICITRLPRSMPNADQCRSK